MLFILVILALGVWFVATMGKKGMDIQQAKTLARTSSRNQDDYRRLAEDATRAQAAIAERLKHLESIKTRLAEVEHLLRVVGEPILAR